MVAAVSGGGDSLALLFLLRDFLAARPDAPRIVAVTVDHGLRPGSAAEADAVAALCAGHGIPHRTLCWRDRPKAGLAAAAREARYRLLAQAADTAETDIVMVGHTRDDQAETVWMRRARVVGCADGQDGGGRGEAGMAPLTLYDWRIWLLRPLLGVGRAELRAWLRRRGIEWSDDPTNEDTRHERVRARRALAGAGECEAARLTRRAADAGRERSERSTRAADLVGAHATRPAPGLLRLGPDFLRHAEEPAALDALRVLLALAGGREHLPDEGRSAALLRHLAQVRGRANLSRCVVDSRGAGIFLYREHRTLPAAAEAESGVWDGRFTINKQELPPRSVIAPFGAATAEQMPAPPPDVPASIARAALFAEPALWAGPKCLGHAAEAGEGACVARVAPWARFLPGFDLAVADVAAALVGAPAFASPVCHKELIA